MPFQEWFVGRRAQPAVRAVRFEGRPPPAPGVLAAIEACELVLIGPSNPYVSIDPILSLDGVAAALARKPVVAVSPIVGGRAVKGPLGTMIPQLTGAPATAAAIARHYGALLRGLVVERGDERDVGGVAVRATDTLMRSRDDRLRLARETLAFAAELMSGMSVWALVPAKAFDRGKSRLMPALDDEARAAFARSLFDHVLGTLTASGVVDGVLVATDSPAVAAAARAHGAAVRLRFARCGHARRRRRRAAWRSWRRGARQRRWC